jgi:hypothetical protein
MAQYRVLASEGRQRYIYTKTHKYKGKKTLSIVPCHQNTSPSGPLLKGADGQPIPSWGFIKKTVQFQGKLFTSTFLQAAVADPILGIDFLRKFKVIVSPELSQIQFACSAAAPSAHILPSAAPSANISHQRLRPPHFARPVLILGKTSLC